MPLPLTIDEVWQRVAVTDSQPVDYLLGGGQARANAPHPWKAFTVGDQYYARGCDCSAAACWIVGVDKYDPITRLWYGTDNMWGDATGPQRRFKRLNAATQGCLAVYPHYTRNGKQQAGHVGLVIDPVEHLVIDCAGGVDDDQPGVGDAITKRIAHFFWNPSPPYRRAAIFVWPVNVTDC